MPEPNHDEGKRDGRFWRRAVAGWWLVHWVSSAALVSVAWCVGCSCDLDTLLAGKSAEDRAFSEIADAIASGDLARVEDLLDSGADPNRRGPLHLAISFNQVRIAELLLDRGAEANVLMGGSREIGRGYSMLSWAVQLGRVGIAELLLRHGADANARDHTGAAPLHTAALENHLMVLSSVKYVVEGRGKPWVRRVPPPGALELEPGHVPKMVRLLLENGADPNLRYEGSTPLHLAMGSHHEDPGAIVEALLEHGADASAVDDDGRTPLHFAAEWEGEAIAAALLRGGAPLEARDKRGRTALHQAAFRGNTPVVELLLTEGADVGAWDDEGRRPLSLAVQEGHGDVAELLRQHGAVE